DWRSRPAEVQGAVADAVGFPCFVKPANLGSSVGISKVKAAEELTAALDLAARHDRRLLVERAVQGREVEVAVLGNDAPEASVPGEVCYAGEWYDYETKYGQGHTTFKVPAPLAPEVTARVRELAIRAFQAIDGAGLARVDVAGWPGSPPARGSVPTASRPTVAGRSARRRSARAAVAR